MRLPSAAAELLASMKICNWEWKKALDSDVMEEMQRVDIRHISTQRIARFATTKMF